MDHDRAQTFDGLSSIIERFERAWQQGVKLGIEECLDEHLGRQRRSLLVELVHADLEFRLKAGESARVEEYVARYPELSSDADTLVELLTREFEFRRRTDQSLSLDEYRTRWPDHVTALAERFAPFNSNGPSSTVSMPTATR